MDVTVKRNVDSDTDVVGIPDEVYPEKVNYERARYLWTGGSESKKSDTNEGKISAKGKQQSKDASTLVKPGDVLTVADEFDRGTFNRPLLYPYKEFDGKTVDLGFVKSAQGINSYNTDFGLAPDELHQKLKTTYNDYVPYQFRDQIVPIDVDEYGSIGMQMFDIQNEMRKPETLAGDTKALDKMVGDLYGDGGDKRVAAFLDVQKRAKLQRDMSAGPLTAEKIMHDAFQSVAMRKAWDKAVVAKDGTNSITQAYKKDGTTFFDKGSAALQLYNDMSNYIDLGMLYAAQHSDMATTDDRLAEEAAKLPDELRSRVLIEAEKYGNDRALIFSKQLIQDVGSKETFMDQGLLGQMGFGMAAFLSSPTSVIAGAKAYGVADKAVKAVKIWEGHAALKGLAYTGLWTGAAAVESVAFNAPRTMGDRTYTTRDFLLDTVLDTTIGAAIPLALTAGNAALKPFVKDYLVRRNALNAKKVEKLTERLKNEETRQPTKGQSVTEQMSNGVLREEKTRRLNNNRKKAAAANGEESSSIVEGNAPPTTNGTGTGPEQGVPPIGDRPAEVGVDGKGVSQGELDAEMSVDLPVIHNTPWLNRIKETPAGSYPRPLDGTMSSGERAARGFTDIDGLVSQYNAHKKMYMDVTETLSGSGKVASKLQEKSLDFDAKEMKRLKNALGKIGISREKIAKITEEHKASGRAASDPRPKITKGVSQRELDSLESQQRVEDVVNGGWIKSGLDETFRKAKDAISTLGKVGSGVANLTGKAMAHRMQDSVNDAIRFVGFNFAEDPRGFGGNVQRGTTVALRQVLEKNRSMTQILPNLAMQLEKFAQSKGASWWGKKKAKWGTGKGDNLAQQFENEFADAINARKMGRKIEVNEHVDKMVDDWVKFMEYNGTRAIKEGVPGWTQLRKNYFPQLSKNQAMHDFIRDHKVGTDGVSGKEKLEDLFRQGMKNSKDAGLHDLEDEAIDELAEKMVKKARTGEKDLPTSKAGQLARTQHRVEMDWSATAHGLTLRDFLQTDIARVADTYTNDLGGRLALNAVTGGKIVTDSDLAALKTVAIAKHSDAMKVLTGKGKTTEAAQLEKVFKQELGMLDDTLNMILGRPAQGGLPPELRHFKEFITTTRMGILGTSQSIETGNLLARSTTNLFNDPKMIKATLGLDPNTPEGKALLFDVMNITGRTTDMEYLHRPSQVLSDESLKSHSKLRQLTIRIADTMTGGDLKQPAARMLGQSSMFNWVMKKESGYAQKSFLIESDKYFNKGKCAIPTDRMVDLGMIDRDGINTELSHVFKTLVEKDKHGLVTALNWDKWPKKAQYQYMDAAQRDEAQRLQQTFAGEAPVYYNNPLMKFLFQFREVPLVAQNKQMARNLAFGDVETASSIMLNLAIAGMVRYGWVGGIGLAKAAVTGETENYNLPGLDRLDVMRYQAQFGMIPDVLEIANSGFQSYNEGSTREIARQVPFLGLLKDYRDFATGDNPNNPREEAVQGLTLTGTVWYMDIIHEMFIHNLSAMKGE